MTAIDVHGHISPPESLRRFPMPPSLGDVEGMIERKQAAGIGLTIVGSPVGAGAMVPVPGMDNYAQPVDRLRAFHDWLAGMVARYPRHLRAYVYVNPFGDDDHLRAAAETATREEFVGLIVNSSVNGRYLDSPDADAFFALAAESGLPVVMHAPASPAAGTGMTDFRMLEQLGRYCDVAIGAAACALGGWWERYPTLELVVTTAGGALALLAERLDAAWHSEHWQGARDSGVASEPRPEWRPPRSVGPAVLSRPPSHYFERMWVDTATTSDLAVSAAYGVFGPERILLGTDSPPMENAVQRCLSSVEHLGLDEPAYAAVLENNARRLFGARLPMP